MGESDLGAVACPLPKVERPLRVAEFYGVFEAVRALDRPERTGLRSRGALKKFARQRGMGGQGAAAYAAAGGRDDAAPSASWSIRKG